MLLDRIERLESRLATMEANTLGTTLATSSKIAKPEVGPDSLVASVGTPSGPAAPPQASPTPPRPTIAAPPQHIIPDALQAPESTPGVDNFTPFAYGDFTWLNGSPRTKDPVLDTKFFTPEVRFDTHFMADFNQPKDHTMGGSTEQFRSGEIPDGADQRRRRFPLAERSRQDPDHVRDVRDDDAAQ